jgi:hypothetical protein
MAKEQFHDGFPTEFLTTIGLLDFTTTILAIIAAIALKNKWSLPFHYYGYSIL